MSTNRSVDCFAVAQDKDRPAVKDKKDRSCLCAFTFADGRQRRTPRRAGRDISSFLSGSYLSACDLSSALARLFSAVAEGQIKPKTASTLAYLGQILLQTIQHAEHEYTNAFGTDSWREAVGSSFAPPPLSRNRIPNQTRTNQL